jgi:hypothetical protein
MKRKRRQRPRPPFIEFAAPPPFDPSDGIQIVGTPEQFASGAEPHMRPMRIEDLDDECPICMANRRRILEGDPPMVLAFD